MKNLLNLFSRDKSQKDDFSDFFHNASISEKKKLFKGVVMKANQDQKKIIEEAKNLSQ